MENYAPKQNLYPDRDRSELDGRSDRLITAEDVKKLRQLSLDCSIRLPFLLPDSPLATYPDRDQITLFSLK